VRQRRGGLGFRVTHTFDSAAEGFLERTAVIVGGDALLADECGGSAGTFAEKDEGFELGSGGGATLAPA